MGVILSQFRRKKPLLNQLEELEEEIRAIEQYAANLNTHHRSVHQKILYGGSFLVLMSSFYIYYFHYKTDVMSKAVITSAILAMIIFIFFLNRLTSWYYFKQIKSNRTKIRDLQEAKKKILDEVEEKENYKTAKEILEKFAPERSPVRPPFPRAQNLAIAPVKPITKNLPAPRQDSTIISSRLPHSPVAPSNNKVIAPLNYPLSKSFVERALEYLLGDGPSNRFALICSFCSAHNGMALKEEYPFISFKCYVCKTFNPSKQVKLQQPRLEWNQPSQSATTSTIVAADGPETIDKPDNNEDSQLTETKETAGTSTEEASTLPADEDDKKCLPKEAVEETSGP